MEWIIRTETNDDYDSVDAVVATASAEQDTVKLRCDKSGGRIYSFRVIPGGFMLLSDFTQDLS